MSHFSASAQSATGDLKSSSSDKKYGGNDAGFTLLEMMIVIAIIAVLGALVGPPLVAHLTKAKVSVSRQQIANLGGALTTYKLDVGEYPTSEQGLQALLSKPTDVEGWEGPYIQQKVVPKDPWGHDFIYRNPANRDGFSYDLCTLGPKGSTNGSDNDFSLCNDE